MPIAPAPISTTRSPVGRAGAPRSVQADRQRLGEPGEVERQAGRQARQHRLGRRDQLGHPAVDVEPERRVATGRCWCGPRRQRSHSPHHTPAPEATHVADREPRRRGRSRRPRRRTRGRGSAGRRGRSPGAGARPGRCGPARTTRSRRCRTSRCAAPGAAPRRRRAAGTGRVLDAHVAGAVVDRGPHAPALRVRSPLAAALRRVQVRLRAADVRAAARRP